MDWMIYLKSFIVGGLFCVVAQIIIDKTKVTSARILVGYVVAGVLFTAIGLYEPLVNYAGAGATVPLTGFGYALAQGVVEAVMKDGLWGALYGGITATAAGISAALCFAVIWALFFRSEQK